MNDASQKKYPLLDGILNDRNLSPQPMYKTSDVANIFKVCVRAIQNWMSAGRLKYRDLPGGWRFLPQDLEDFLNNSSKKGAC